MGVYIANMEKPKSCAECPFEVIDTSGYPRCVIMQEMVVDGNLFNDCPLEEVDLVRKPIKDYEGYYEVDQFGRVFSVERTVTVNDNGRVYEKPVKSKQIKQQLHSEGYKIVSLTRGGKTKTHYVHRLVAEAFIDNPNNYPTVNHKDEDKTNNFVDNLEWCTYEYNVTYGTARERQAEALRGRKMPEETKKKISDTNKATWRKNHGERRNDE